MKKQYQHISFEERETISRGLAKGLSLRAIAKELGRHHRTVAREVKKNTSYYNQYRAIAAQKRYERVTQKQRAKAPLKEPLIYLYVREHIRMGWSPETIAGRLPLEHPGHTITPETIYQYIYKRQNKKFKLYTYLKNRRKKRIKKEGRSVVRRGAIPGALSIDARPEEVKQRTSYGHWETDLMEGPKQTGAVLSVTVERKSRYTVIEKIENKTAREKTHSLIASLKEFPVFLRQSITTDNGKENSYHTAITTILNLPVYFCHAYHAWEKGTIENTIGRIRYFLPKKTNLNPVSVSYVQALQKRLNNTPRKCLQYRTPEEVLREVLSS